MASTRSDRRRIGGPGLAELPGHLIRRAHQIAVSMFIDAVGRDLTPVQYAVLRALQERPDIDQVTLAREAALDTSTAADTAARLEAKGWLTRTVQAGRQYRLALTDAGRSMLERTAPAIERMNRDLLAALDAADRAEFLRLLDALVSAHNVRSRAPRRSGTRADDVDR